MMSKIFRKYYPAATVLLILLVLWETAPRILDLPAVFLAPPSEVVRDFIADPQQLLKATLDTLIELAGAAVVATVGGFLIGLIVSSLRSFNFLLGWLGHFYAIPFVMLYPLFTIWLGLGESSRIVFGGFYGMIPMALSVGAALKSIDESWAETAESFGADRRQQMLRVRIPLALPGIFSGLKLGVSLAFVGVIVGEMLASDRGLGFVLTASRAVFDVTMLYGAVLAVMIFALIMNFAIDALERAVSPWPPGSGKETA